MTSRRIEELTAELAQWKQALGGDSGPQTPAEVPVFLREAERVQGHVAALEIAKLRTALAAERSAREQAEKQLAHTEDLLRGTADSARNWEEMCEQAWRWRDTALARVKELEISETALKGMVERQALNSHDLREEKENWVKRAYCAEGELEAVETALASAREHARIALAYLDDKEDVESTPLHAIGHARTELRALLSSAPSPAPVAAPHPSCIYAACKQGGPCMYPKPDGTACALIEAPVAEPDPLPEYEPPRMTERRAIWRCTIGINEVISLPAGCDQAMRCAAWQAFARVVGRDPVFAFSGWNTELTEEQLAVVENRMSRPPVAAPCAGCTSARTAITEALRLYAGGHEHSDALRAWLQEHP